MILNLFKRNTKKPEEFTALRLYEACVRQAREPVFYEQYAVPDSVDGRFEMIALHVILLMNQMYRFQSPQAEILAQNLFDQMFLDMDRSLREMGVSDLAVPKRMKVMMNGFNGRARAYRQALQDTVPEAVLGEVIRRNIYGTLPEVKEGDLQKMEAYIRDQNEGLMALQFSHLLEGNRIFVSADELLE